VIGRADLAWLVEIVDVIRNGRVDEHTDAIGPVEIDRFERRAGSVMARTT
jgi:hypothetical protein